MKKLLFPLLCAVAFASGFFLTSCLKEQLPATAENAKSVTEQTTSEIPVPSSLVGAQAATCTTGDCTYKIKLLSVVGNAKYILNVRRVLCGAELCKNIYNYESLWLGLSLNLPIMHDSFLHFDGTVFGSNGTPIPGTINIRLTRSNGTFFDVAVPSQGPPQIVSVLCPGILWKQPCASGNDG